MTQKVLLSTGIRDLGQMSEIDSLDARNRVEMAVSAGLGETRNRVEKSGRAVRKTGPAGGLGEARNRVEKQGRAGRKTGSEASFGTPRNRVDFSSPRHPRTPRRSRRRRHMRGAKTGIFTLPIKHSLGSNS